MNYTTSVFLINKDVRAIATTYENTEKAERTKFKTLDHSIQVNDLVIVPTNTRHGFTVVKVVETDVDVDFESSHQMQWVVEVLERAEYDKVLAMENQAIQAIKSAELRKKRDDLRAALILDNEALKALSITTATDPSAPIEPPPIA